MNVQSLFPVTVLLAITLLVSCEQRERKLPQPLPLFSDVSVWTETESDPYPNHYRVWIRWRATGNPRSWAIERRENSDPPIAIATVNGDRREYLDSQAVPGKTYTYSISIRDGQGANVRWQTKITVAQDLEINDRVELSKFSALPNLAVKRLFLGKNGRLITNGENVVITADEIFSDGATIQSFRYGQIAPMGKAGRSGGRIEIHAHHATGTLYVIAAGERGGLGIRGTSVTTAAARGQSGVNGKCGYHGREVNCESMTPNNLELWRRLAIIPGPTHIIYSDALSKLYCAQQTGDGLPGEAGAEGGPGGAGGQGGNSGEIYVRVDELKDFQVKPSLYAGEGGTGGAGGNGGPGGPGGDPGRPDHLLLCRIALQGPTGPTGKSGSWGENGKGGKVQTYCLSLANHLIGECQNPNP